MAFIMKQTAFFLTLTLIAFNTSFGQKKFSEGFIVNNSNDTVKGLIEHQDWAQNPETIKFRDAPGSGEIVYSPSDIRAFKVANETYVSGVVTIDASKDMDYSNKVENVVDTTFLLVLVNGEKSLYYLKSKMLKEYFFIKKDNVFETLFNKEYLVRNEGGGVYSKKREAYKGQLNGYLNDCPEIMKNISATSYTRNDLTRLFDKYYTCTGKNIVYQKELRKLTTEFGVLTGMSITNIEFKSANGGFDRLVNSNFPSSVNPFVGVHLNVVIRNLSLVNELMYTTYNTSSVYRDSGDEYRYSITTSKIGFSLVRLNNLLRFRVPVKLGSFFVDGGISNGIYVSSKNYKSVLLYEYSKETSYEGKAIDKDLNAEQGILGGVGASFKNYSFEFRIEKNGAKSPYPQLKAPIDRSMFIFNYKF
jgi:hypothetical protein